MTFEISKDLVDIMSREHDDLQKKDNVSEIIKRMSQRAVPLSSNNKSPYSQLLDTAKHKTETLKTPYRVRLDKENRKSKRDNRVDEIISKFLNIYSYIDDKDPSIRFKLIKFMRSYYDCKMLEVLKEHNKTNELFSSLRNNK
jgi:hypothetical protein